MFDQLPRVSAIFVLLGHAIDQESLPFVNNGDSFLREPVDRWTDINPDMVGVYGHFDVRRSRWVRSGKCLSSRSDYTFTNRLQDHYKGSMNPKKSLFYNSYPESRDTRRVRDVPLRGVFSDLKVKMLLGCGFENTGRVVSVLRWTAPVLRRAAQSGHTLWKKGELIRKGQMCVYLFELSYQLCMSDRDVVSESPGCEVPWFRFSHPQSLI